MRAAITVLLTLWIAAAQAAEPRFAVLETSMGDITVELDAARAPKTVNAFVAYARAKVYDNTIFHRVVKDFVVQGGELPLPQKGENPSPVWPGARVPSFEPESKNGLKNKRGTIAAARVTANADGNAPSGFFINAKDNEVLDYRRFELETMVPTPRGMQKPPAGTEIEGYTVFGRVVSGMDVVDRIQRVPVTNATPPHEHMPVSPVVVKQVRLVTTVGAERKR